MKTYIVEKDAIVHNLEVLQKKAGDTPIWAVLKGNGYGLGVEPMAQLCWEQEIRRFAVTEPSEARSIRNLYPEAKILMLRKDDPTKYVFQHYWIPEGKLQSSDDKKAGAKYLEWARAGILTVCKGGDIDLTLVADWFYQIYKSYGIMLYKCGYDVKFSKEFLRRMEHYGFDEPTARQALMFYRERFLEKGIYISPGMG